MSKIDSNWIRPNHIPEPFLGRMTLEMCSEDITEYMRKRLGMMDSILELPETITEGLTVPLVKGIVKEMADDCFGEAYRRRYGVDSSDVNIGDTVFIIRNQSYRLDIENKYHSISDQDIVGVIRQTKEKVEN